jgi:hypothetical protein
MARQPKHQVAAQPAYSVGQVLYAVMRTSMTVVPLQVVEVIRKQTMQGEETGYIVNVHVNSPEPNTSEQRTLDIKKIDGEMFESLDVVRQALVSRATSAIDAMLAGAKKNAGDRYGTQAVSQKTKASVPVQSPLDMPVQSNRITVEMPDGTVASVKMPEIT